MSTHRACVLSGFLLCCLSVQAAQSGPCYLVKHLNIDATQGSSMDTNFHSFVPRQFAVIGSTGYFVANDGVHGQQLWKTDGTTNGTAIVRIIDATTQLIDNLTPMGSTLFFTARTAELIHGQNTYDRAVDCYQLWRTDGTAAGTFPVTQFSASSNASGYPALGLCSLGTKLLCLVPDPVTGLYSLVVSDGTIAGTHFVTTPSGANVIVADNSFTGSSFGQSGNSLIVNLGGVGYFAGKASTGDTTGFELWRSDGTTAGTSMVVDINPGTGQSRIDQLTVAGNYAFFVASDTGANTASQLWRTNGTAGGTIKLGTYINTDNSRIEALIDVAGSLVFDADDGTSKNIYKTDGNTITTVITRTGPVTYQFSRQNNSVANGKLYYLARVTNAFALYETDIVNNLDTQLIPDGVNSMLPIGTKIFFSRAGSATGLELLVYDRMSNQNYLVQDINPGTADSNPISFYNFAGFLFFTANDGVHGYEPWQSDGVNNTYMIKDINTTSASDVASPLTASNGLVYFTGNPRPVPNITHQLYRSDGTAQGTGFTDATLKTFTNASSKIDFNNQLQFGAQYYDTNDQVQYYGSALYSTTGGLGSSANATGLIDVNGTGVDDLVVLDSSHLLFTAVLGLTGYKALYVTNGAPGNHTQLKQNFQRPLGSNLFSRGQAFNGFVYYNADDGTTHGIWRTDGVNPPTLFSSIVPNSYNDNPGDAPQCFYVVGNRMMFVGIDSLHLYSTDGNTVTTVLTLPQGLGFSIAGTRLAVCQGKLCFLYNTGGSIYYDLYTSDGLTVTQLTNFTNAAGQFFFNGDASLVDVNGTLYSTANSGQFSGNNSLCKSDLTSAGTVLVRTWAPTIPFAPQFFNANGTLVFAAQGYFGDAGNFSPFGTELWRSDGTAAGTVMIQDIYPGFQSGFDTTQRANYFCVAGSNLYFVADSTPNASRELWAMPLSALTAPAPVLTSSVPVYAGTVGVSIPPIQINSTNGPNTFGALNLPLGLSIDPATGIISGTPLLRNPYVLTSVYATNGNAVGAVQLLFHIGGDAPEFATTPDLSILHTQLTITPYTPVVSGVTPLTYSLTGTVPPWVNLNTSTGVISGTPGANDYGAFTFKLVAANSAGSTSQDVAGTVLPPPPVIDSPLTANGFTGADFTYTIHAAGTGQLGYIIDILPQGLQFDQVATISGNPTSASVTNVDMYALDSFGQQSAHKTLVITIAQGVAPLITNSTLTASGTVGVPFTPYTITASGSTPIHFSAFPLSTGLTLTGATISGTPQRAGTTQVGLTATNGTAPDDNKTLVITITNGGGGGVPPTITSPANVQVAAGANFSYQVTASGDAPITYSAPVLPPELTFSVDTASGVFPTVGTKQLTVKATNAISSDTLIVNITVVAPPPPQAPAITSANNTTFTVGTAGSFTVSATGNPVPAVASTSALPPGVTFTGGTSSGTLGGTPAAGSAGSYPLIITASNGVNPQASQTFTLTVVDATPAVSAPTIVSGPSAAPTVAGIGQDISYSVVTNGAETAIIWTFGDGTTGQGATVKHHYDVAGLFISSVAVSNSAGNVSGSVSVKVAAPLAGGGPDSDGDGYSDAIEIAAGTDPHDPLSNPGGGLPPVVEQEKGKTVKISKKLKLSFMTTVPIPAGFAIDGKPAVVMVGDYSQHFKFNSKGLGATQKDSIRITIKAKKGVVAAQNSKVIITLLDVPDTVTPNSPVEILIGGLLFTP